MVSGILLHCFVASVIIVLRMLHDLFKYSDERDYEMKAVT